MKNPILTDTHPQADMPDGSFFYTGPSMRPTFHPGDRFLVEKTPMDQLKVGDVVIFEQHHPEDKAINVVHRIVVRRSGQLFTRGDNNLHPDPLPLQENTYQGRVAALDRYPFTRKIWRGAAGWMYAMVLYQKNRGWMLLKRIFFPLYGIIRTVNHNGKLWNPAITTLIIRTPNGIIIKYLFRGRSVAQYHLHTGAFICRKPFDLVIEKPIPWKEIRTKN